MHLDHVDAHGWREAVSYTRWRAIVFTWAVNLGCVIAFVIAIAHPSDAVQIGGGQGIILRSWLVMVLAPVVFIAAVALRRRLRAGYLRQLQAEQEHIPDLYKDS
jgi:hypothetical protein